MPRLGWLVRCQSAQNSHSYTLVGRVGSERSPIPSTIFASSSVRYRTFPVRSHRCLHRPPMIGRYGEGMAAGTRTRISASCRRALPIELRTITDSRSTRWIRVGARRTRPGAAPPVAPTTTRRSPRGRPLACPRVAVPCTPGGTRTHDLTIKSRQLWPLSYRRMTGVGDYALLRRGGWPRPGWRSRRIPLPARASLPGLPSAVAIRVGPGATRSEIRLARAFPLRGCRVGGIRRTPALQPAPQMRRGTFPTWTHRDSNPEPPPCRGGALPVAPRAHAPAASPLAESRAAGNYPYRS